MRIFRIPRSRFGYAQSSVAKLAGVPISGTCGPARLVSHFLGTLADEAAAASPGMANNIAMVTRGIDLVGTMAADLVANADLSAAAAAELRNRVLAYIDENLSDSRLGVAQVARAHGVSVRSLQKLFAITGRTVSETIPQGRLEAIRRELELPRSKDRTIFSVARDHGYVDGPHFSRSFRAAYGMSPHAWQTYTRGLSGI